MMLGLLLAPLLFCSVTARSAGHVIRVEDCNPVPSISKDIGFGGDVKANCSPKKDLCTPQSVANGKVRVSGYSSGDSIEYKCNNRTTTVGKTSGQCTSDGQWNIPPPKCLAHCREYRLEHGNNHYKNLSELGHVSHGSKIPISCNYWYLHQLSPMCKDASVICDNGRWTGCTASTCQPTGIYSQITPGIERCVAAQDRDLAVSKYADLLLASCGSDIASLDTCVANVTLRVLGRACRDVNALRFSEQLRTRMRHFITTRQWIPYRTTPSRREDPQEEVTCEDTRMTGQLCSHWKPDVHASRQQLCRQDHTCGYHGYDYKWCYIDRSDNWEYCCTGSCGYHGEDYLWCQAGDEWEYCRL